jgi:chromosome partition protein MukE
MLQSRKFAELDVALRSGRHISRHDYIDYEFVTHNFDDLESFYANYGCKLVQHPDGFYFLLPRSGLIPARQLSKGAMHLGQFIALKMRDPEVTRTNGHMSIDALIRDLETSVPVETLSQVYAPKQKEVLTSSRVHEEVLRSLRTLEELGFVRRAGDSIVALEAIHRFSEMARQRNAPSETTLVALQIQRGVVITREHANEEVTDAREDP